MANHNLLSLIPLGFNFDYSHITLPLAFVRHYHFSLLIGLVWATKKPAKKSFRVLAGIDGKPKRLCATFLILLFNYILIYTYKQENMFVHYIYGTDASGSLSTESLLISTCIYADQPSQMRMKQCELRIHPWNIGNISYSFNL